MGSLPEVGADARETTGGGREPPIGDGPADASLVFPHLDARGHARMVDVTGKATTGRRALARGRVALAPAAAARFADTPGLKDALAEARTAALFAAKATSDLLPLCHPIRIGEVTVDFELRPDGVEIAASIEAADRTGVEMEALTACVVAALTLLAHCSLHDLTASIEDVAVWEKSGGRSGTWQRRNDGAVDHAPAQQGT